MPGKPTNKPLDTIAQNSNGFWWLQQYHSCIHHQRKQHVIHAQPDFAADLARNLFLATATEAISPWKPANKTGCTGEIFCYEALANNSQIKCRSRSLL